MDWRIEGRVVVERIDQPGRTLRAPGQQFSVLAGGKQERTFRPIFARNYLHIFVHRPQNNGILAFQSNELEHIAEQDAFKCKLPLFKWTAVVTL